MSRRMRPGPADLKFWAEMPKMSPAQRSFASHVWNCLLDHRGAPPADDAATFLALVARLLNRHNLLPLELAVTTFVLIRLRRRLSDVLEADRLPAAPILVLHLLHRGLRNEE